MLRSIAFLLAFLPHLAVAALPMGGSTPPAAPSGSLPNINVFSTTGSSVSGPTIGRWVQVFKQGSVPSGQIPLWQAGGVTQPCTMARRNDTWPDGSLKMADFICRLSATVPASSALTLSAVLSPGSWASTDTLPGSDTVSSILASLQANFADETFTLSTLKNGAGSTVGSGTWSASLFRSLNAAAHNGGVLTLATGQTALDFVSWMKITDNTGGAVNTNLIVRFYVTLHLIPSTGAIDKVESCAFVQQGFMSVANDTFTYTAAQKLGSTTTNTYAGATITQYYAGESQLERSDGHCDMWGTANTTSFATRPTIRYEHDVSYMKAAGLLLPLDSSIVMNPSHEASPQGVAPGNTGQLPVEQGAAGAAVWLGPMPDWGTRWTNAQPDDTGYAQTARAQSLAQAVIPIHWMADDTNARIVAVNNGHANSGTAYSGLGTLQPTAWFQDGSGGDQSIFTQPLHDSPWNGENFDMSHWAHATYVPYVYDGYSFNQQLTIDICNWAAIQKPTGNSTTRKRTLSGGSVVYQVMFNTVVRDDDNALIACSYAANVATTNSSLSTVTAEGAYMGDLLNDTHAGIVDFVNQGTATFKTAGWWQITHTLNTIESVDFYQMQFQLATFLSYAGWKSANATSVAQFAAQAVNGEWVTATVPGVFSATYRGPQTRASAPADDPPGTNTNDYFDGTHLGYWIGIFDVDSSGIFTVETGSEATANCAASVCYFAASTIQIQAGDVLRPTASDPNNECAGVGSIGGINQCPSPTPPQTQPGFPASGLTILQSYFACSVTQGGSGTVSFKLSTTQNLGSPNTCASPVTPAATNGINMWWNGFNSGVTPGTFASHNSAASDAYQTGYYRQMGAVITAGVRYGLLSQTALTRFTTLINLETGAPDSPSSGPPNGPYNSWMFCLSC